MPQLFVDLSLASRPAAVSAENGRYSEYELGTGFMLSAELGRTHLRILHDWHLHDHVGHDAEFEGNVLGTLLSASSFASPYIALTTDADGIQLTQELHDAGSLRVAFASEQPSSAARNAGVDLWVAEVVGKLNRSSIIALQLGGAIEKRRLLGTVGGGALAVPPRSSTVFSRISATLQLDNGMDLFGQASLGFTDPGRSDGSLIKNVSALRSSSFALGMAHRSLFTPDDALTLAVSQPLRVDAGAAIMDRPIRRSRDGDILRRSERIGLEPEGRELDFEFSYRFPLGGSAAVGLNWLGQLEPGHDRDASPTHTLAFKLQAAF